MTATNAPTCTQEVTAAAFEARVRNLPLGLALEHEADNEWKLNSILTSWPYLIGEMPHHWNLLLTNVDADRLVVPVGGVLVRSCHGYHGDSHVVAGDGWVATIAKRTDGSVFFSLSAVSDNAAAPVLAEARTWEASPTLEPERVHVSFMYCGTNGAYYTRRTLDVPEWDAIRRNYAPAVQTHVDSLVAYTAQDLPSGRLLLLHGPPGTGKTTLLRSLAFAWREWCRTYVVVDPEALFSNPSYMFEAILGEDDDEVGKSWRLFVVEDCDEFIRAEAKERTGQALSRLLNIADGLIGQGARVIICITTNEEVGRLHPAVRRPGRCLAEIEVPRLSRAAAREWLATNDHGRVTVAADAASIAELYALVNGEARGVEVEPPLAVGQYL